MDDQQQETKNSKKNLVKGRFMSPTAASKLRVQKEQVHNKAERSEQSGSRQSRKITSRISEERYSQLMHRKRDGSKQRNNQHKTVQHTPDGGDSELGTDFFSSRHNRDSAPSQYKGEDQLYVPKGPHFVTKKTTKIIKGGPSNMEKRVNTRQSKSRDPQFRESRMNDMSSFQGMEGSSILSTSNFVSMKGNTEKAYQQRKVGIYGLKPYMSEKTIVPLEEPKPNQVNLALQHMHIKRDLATLRGDAAQSQLEPVPAKETSEEEDFVSMKEMETNKSYLYLITKLEMRELLFEINYLPFLKNQQKYNVDSKILLENHKAGHGSNFKEEIQLALVLVDQLWLLLNIEDAERIRRYDFYKIMKILMLNIGKLSESEMHFRLARFFIRRWERYGVTLRPPRAPEASNPQPKVELQQDAMNSIQEETDTKARMIFNLYQKPVKGNDGKERSQEELDNLSDVQLVNQYHLSQNSMVFTIQRFYKAFKHDHAQRFAYIQHEEATQKTTKIMLSPRLQLEKQTHETLNMIPVDGRKYKEHTIKDVIDQHSFRPKISGKYDKAVELRYAKLKEQMQDDFRSLERIKIFEQGPESNRIRRQINLDDHDDQYNLKGGHNGSLNIAVDARQRNRSNQKYLQPDGSDLSKMAFSDSGKLDFNQKYQIQMYELKRKEQDRQRKKEDLDREEMQKDECTFSPRINKKFQSHRPMSPNEGRSFWDRTLASKEAESNYMEAQTNQLTRFAWSEAEKKRQKEEAELTFRPRINKKRPPMIRSMSEMSKQDYRSDDDYPFDGMGHFDQLKRSVNGFEKAVKRMKDHQAEQESRKKKVSDLARGMNYAKLRALESRPPSFIVSPRPKKKSRLRYYDLPLTSAKKGNIIFNAHISITPTRTESLIMREGEDPKMVAELFAQRFNLGETAKQTLIQQLEYNIKLKRERKLMEKSSYTGGYSGTEKTTKLRSSQILESRDYNRISMGSVPKSRERSQYKQSPYGDLKRSTVSSGIWSPTSSVSPQQPRGSKQGAHNKDSAYSRGKVTSDKNNAKSITNFQSVPGIKSPQLRQPSNDRSRLKPPATKRESSQPKGENAQRELAQRQHAQTNKQIYSASVKQLRNITEAGKRTAGEQANQRNRKFRLAADLKENSNLESSPTQIDADSSPMLEEHGRRRQRQTYTQAMKYKPGKHTPAESQQIMDQTETSKNANISSNNDLSAIELIKDDNPNQNVDLISLIRSDADVVVASQESKPRTNIVLTSRGRAYRHQSAVSEEDEEGLDDEEQPPEETEGDERIDGETINRSIMKNNAMDDEQYSGNGSTIKWSNRQSMIDAERYQTADLINQPRRNFDDGQKKKESTFQQSLHQQDQRQTTLRTQIMKDQRQKVKQQQRQSQQQQQTTGQVMTKMVIQRSNKKDRQSAEKDYMQLMNTSDDQVDFHLSASKTLSKAPMETQQSVQPSGVGEFTTVRKTQRVQGGTTTTVVRQQQQQQVVTVVQKKVVQRKVVKQ